MIYLLSAELRRESAGVDVDDDEPERAGTFINLSRIDSRRSARKKSRACAQIAFNCLNDPTDWLTPNLTLLLLRICCNYYTCLRLIIVISARTTIIIWEINIRTIIRCLFIWRIIIVFDNYLRQLFGPITCGNYFGAIVCGQLRFFFSSAGPGNYQFLGFRIVIRFIFPCLFCSCFADYGIPFESVICACQFALIDRSRKRIVFIIGNLPIIIPFLPLL